MGTGILRALDLSSESKALLEDARSARVQREMRRHWKRKLRAQPPAKREQFLKSQEGRSALGARTCDDLLRLIRSQAAALGSAVAAAASIEAYEWQGEMPPGFRFGGDGELLTPGEVDDGRRHAVRLQLSREMSRNGLEHPVGTPMDEMPIAGRPSRRWTPPQAVSVEDQMDAMTPKQADYYKFPVSPSAVAIFQIIARGGQERAQHAARSHRTGGRNISYFR